MPMLLEDLAEETSASNRRVADRVDAEVRSLTQWVETAVALGNLRQVAGRLETVLVHGLLAPGALGEARQNTLETARLATDFALSRLPQYEGFMRSAVALLRKRPTRDGAVGLLRTLWDGFKTGQKLIRAIRSLWEIAQQIGVTPERFDELSQAQHRLEELATEAERALEQWTRDWQPADPERLALGLQLAREGDTVRADEARAWFRRTPE